MSRAYRRAVYPLKPIEQLKLELLGDNKAPCTESGPPAGGQHQDGPQRSIIGIV